MNRVTVFIPTYNAQQYLPSLLDRLSSLSPQNYRVLFVDSSSTDDSADLIKAAGFVDLAVIDAAQFDHGGTRTLARELCNSDVVVFITQDALPLSCEDIDRLVDVFSDSSIGAAYGRQIPYDDTNLFGKHLRQFNYDFHSYMRSITDKKKYGIKTAFLSNSFAAYRRSAMDKIGWFKDGLILGEDTYAGALLLNAGYKLAYVADAKVYHSHSYSVFEEFKRYFDIGVFHKMESWILDEFGKPEGEGFRYIKSEFKFLLANKAFFRLPEFFLRNGMKFLGYKIGKHYRILPKPLIQRLSMHHRWWAKFG